LIWARVPKKLAIKAAIRMLFFISQDVSGVEFLFDRRIAK